MNNNNDRKQGSGKRIIIAGGGTGGHIFPAISIANALKKADSSIEILFVGAKGKMEMEKVPQAGFTIKGLDIAGFNRTSILKNISLPFKLVKSFFQVRNIMKEFRPDAVVGVGGYSSFPVLKLAQANNIPTFIHESNSFAGKSNIMLGKHATKIFVASDKMEKFFPRDTILRTGNPVRSSITRVNEIEKATARNFFSLDHDHITVLVVGGSLGARSMNMAFAKDLQLLLDENIQLIWQTGKTDAAKWKEYSSVKDGVYVNEFITEMEMAYAAADIIVSRAGAMAVAELSIVKKPVVFVPYPFAAEDHQTVNAENLVEKDAAVMIKDSEAAEKLVPSVLELAKDRSQQEKLSGNISKLGVTDADKKIASEILKQLAE